MQAARNRRKPPAMAIGSSREREPFLKLIVSANGQIKCETVQFVCIEPVANQMCL